MTHVSYLQRSILAFIWKNDIQHHTNMSDIDIFGADWWKKNRTTLADKGKCATTAKCCWYTTDAKPKTFKLSWFWDALFGSSVCSFLNVFWPIRILVYLFGSSQSAVSQFSLLPHPLDCLSASWMTLQHSLILWTCLICPSFHLVSPAQPSLLYLSYLFFKPGFHHMLTLVTRTFL